MTGAEQVRHHDRGSVEKMRQRRSGCNAVGSATGSKRFKDSRQRIESGTEEESVRSMTIDCRTIPGFSQKPSSVLHGHEATIKFQLLSGSRASLLG